MRDSAFYQQVFAKGELTARRVSVLEVLQARFGEQVAAPFAAALPKIESLELLRSLNRTASRCACLDEFQAALAAT